MTDKTAGYFYIRRPNKGRCIMWCDLYGNQCDFGKVPLRNMVTLSYANTQCVFLHSWHPFIFYQTNGNEAHIS